GRLVNGRPHVAINPADHLVVVPPAVVPQPPVVVEKGEPIRLHLTGELVQVIGKPRPDPARDEPGHPDADFRGPGGKDAPPPPGGAEPPPDAQLAADR